MKRLWCWLFGHKPGISTGTYTARCLRCRRLFEYYAPWPWE